MLAKLFDIYLVIFVLIVLTWVFTGLTFWAPCPPGSGREFVLGLLFIFSLCALTVRLISKFS